MTLYDAGMRTTIEHHFLESARLKQEAATVLSEPIAQAVLLLLASLAAGGKVLACGNGGSACDAQHFAAEFVGRFERERPELPAMALVTDSAILTAVANDYGYEAVFAKQVRALGRAQDVLLAISTSGNSPSVLAAIEAAHQKGLKVVGLTGKGGGQMRTVMRQSDVLIDVPHQQTARIQEVHLLVLHCICAEVDRALLGLAE